MVLPTRFVSIDKFISALDVKPGTTIAVITTRTFPRLNKKNRQTGDPCPFVEQVLHLASRSVVIGAIYENSVNYQRKREGTEEHFSSSALWPSKEFPDGAGVRDGSFTVRHRGTGKRYFALRPTTDKDGVPRIYEEHWFDLCSGLEISKEQVAPFLPPVSEAKSQGTDKTVPWRTVEIANIHEVHCWGETIAILSSVPNAS